MITSPLVSKTTSLINNTDHLNYSEIKERISKEFLFLNLNNFIEKLGNNLKSRFDPELLKIKYLKKMEMTDFLQAKSFLLKELKDFIIEPIYKILEFLYSEFFEKYRNEKNFISRVIYNEIYNSIFRKELEIYSLLWNFYLIENRDNRKKLKKQFSVEKFRSINSYSLDKLFLFTNNSSSTVDSEKSASIIERDAYNNVIHLIEKIKV